MVVAGVRPEEEKSKVYRGIEQSIDLGFDFILRKNTLKL
jgi:hypothetical protein